MPEPLQLPGGVVMTIHARGTDTDGAFTLLTDRLPPGWSLPPHRHLAESETIVVTRGRLRMHVDGDRLDLAVGAAATVPPGVVHDGATVGTDPVERIVVFSPAGMEGFFEALAATRTTADGLRLAEQHGWRFETPPADA